MRPQGGDGCSRAAQKDAYTYVRFQKKEEKTDKTKAIEKVGGH